VVLSRSSRSCFRTEPESGCRAIGSAPKATAIVARNAALVAAIVYPARSLAHLERAFGDAICSAVENLGAHPLLVRQDEIRILARGAAMRRLTCDLIPAATPAPCS
jgi:hypothetical protein